MDQRLEAGRQLLGSGEKSIRSGDYEAARSRFEVALLKFRGPELRLGEAHALRGLARVDLSGGQGERAEVQAREAIKIYGLIREQLETIGDDAVELEFRHA